jgi:hypothetical protein
MIRLRKEAKMANIFRPSHHFRHRLCQVNLQWQNGKIGILEMAKIKFF